LQFGEVEIDDIVMSVGSASTGEMVRYIGYVVEVQVVQHDQLGVACRYDVLLKEISAESVSQGLRLEGMFRQVPARAAVSDDDGRVSH
jgi:hypothetical protein